MLSLWSWLLVALLVALLGEESEGAGISGEEYKNVKVRPLDLKLFEKVEDDWYVVAAYESEPLMFHDIQCLHYHYHVTDEPTVFNITKHERFINQTRDQIEQRYVFTEANNSIVDQYNLGQNADLTIIGKLLDYSVNAPSSMDNYLCYYGSYRRQGHNKDYQLFLALSRQYCATQTPTVAAAVKQALDRVGLKEEQTKNFYNEVCEVEDPIWITTPSE